MDELTLTPVSKKEETPQENKPSADSFEMAPISLNTNGAKDATEAAFEELNTKDIKSLMEQEKLERQKAKEAAANPAPAPAPVKPQGGENAKNKITEIMLTPPEDLKKEEPKAEEKPQEKKEEKTPENQNKGGNQNNNNKSNNNKGNNNKNKNNKGGNQNNKNNNNKPAPAPAPKADELKKEEVKKGIEEIKIPDAMMNENKKVEPVAQKPQNQSNLDSIETKKPVLVDVDANVAQAVGGMSFNEEFALLVKKEEQDNLTSDESRRLKICRLIDMKRKGKPFSDVAQTNFNKFMDEERKAGHDISTFEAAMADIAIATASESKNASNPSVSNLAPINNAKPSAPAPKPVQKTAPQKPSSNEKMGSDNKVLFIVIGIIAVLLIGLLIIIFAGKDKDTPEVPVDTTIVTEETTTTPEETTTPKAETTPILSVNNITKATVLEVITPDTLKVLLKDNSQATVKLIGVKAPVDNEYYAKESLEYTKNALTSKNINLEFDQKLTDDEHNILAYVWTNDGKTLFNDELIVMGYAKTNLDEEDNVKFNEEFKRVEEEAKTAKKGVWGYVAPVYQTTTTKKPTVDPNKMYSSPYISRNLKVFHKNTCPLAYDEKYGKMVYKFEEREDAIKYGCSPCSQCQP